MMRTELFDNIVDRYEDVVANAFVPAAEMYADGDNLYLQLEVPGLKPEEIEVQANAYAVTITGERQEDKYSEQQGLKKSEFRYGKFHRTINFSDTALAVNTIRKNALAKLLAHSTFSTGTFSIDTRKNYNLKAEWDSSSRISIKFRPQN
jgi:Hsp20/alpha crystallin family